MANFSFFEKLKIVFTTILSTPLFSIAALLSVALIVFTIICIIKKKRINKIVYFAGWILVIVFIGLKYTKLIPTLIDNFVDTFIKCLYFPTLGLYVSTIIITNIIFIVVCIQKNINKSYKIASIVVEILLNLLFVLVAGVMTKNKIDITTPINLYTNSTLLVLLQISMFLFVLYILSLLFIRLYNKMTLLDIIKFGDGVDYPTMDKFTIPVLPHRKDEIFVRKVFNSKKQRNEIKVHKLIKKKK